MFQTTNQIVSKYQKFEHLGPKRDLETEFSPPNIPTKVVSWDFNSRNLPLRSTSCNFVSRSSR